VLILVLSLRRSSENEQKFKMEKKWMNSLGFSQSLGNRLSDDVERSGVLFVLNIRRWLAAAAVC
jgi:hypothetical protein